MIGVVALNLGGPDGPDAVEPFLRHLFADPDVIQLGWLRPVQPLLARLIARRRAPHARAAYSQIGGRSPILDETTAQAAAVTDALAARGIAARPFVAMAAWHPFAAEAVAAMRTAGIARAVALPLYPHLSRTTTGSSLRRLRAAARPAGVELAEIDRYPDAPGYIEALGDTIRDALAALPDDARARAPVVFSAHGLPEAYIRRGDPYLDDIRVTVAAVSRRLALGDRARLSFQSRVGPQRWLGPTTEAMLETLAAEGARAVCVCPIAFTGEHIETRQEIDILYRGQAQALGIAHFARARTVGTHPAFVAALADLAAAAARSRGWA